MPKPTRIFRQEDVWHIANLWAEGESCALVGIGSSGKSRLVQSFLKEDVQQFAFKDDWQKYLLIYVDGNGLLEDSAWGLYEEMLDSTISIVGQLRLKNGDHPESEQVFRELNRYHNNLINYEPKLAYRWLARAVTMLFMVARFERIVFMLDDIDRLLREDVLDPTFFRHLKSLRDHHKYRLCYTVATRRTVSALAGDRLPEIDGFYKLIKANTIPIGVYSWEDAELMVKGLMERNRSPLVHQAQIELIRSSGQHPGMLRAMFFALLANQETIEEHVDFAITAGDDGAPAWSRANERKFHNVLRNILQTDPVVREACSSIWESLSERERVAFKRVVDHVPVADYQDALDQLVLKRLIIFNPPNAYEAFSPVFERLVPAMATGRL